MGCGGHKIGPQPRTLKVALIGPRGSGKSTLISCFLEQRFAETYEPTVAPNIGVKAYQFGGAAEVTTLEVWELVDPKVLPLSLNTVLLAIDSSEQTVEQLAQVSHFVSTLKLSVYNLVLTKADLIEGDRDMYVDLVRKQLSLSERVKCYLTSAATREGVRSMFAEIVRPTLTSTATSRNSSAPL